MGFHLDGGLLRVGDSIESVCCTRSPKSPRGSISGGEDGSIISNRHECTVSVGDSIEIFCCTRGSFSPRYSIRRGKYDSIISNRNK